MSTREYPPVSDDLMCAAFLCEGHCTSCLADIEIDPHDATWTRLPNGVIKSGDGKIVLPSLEAFYCASCGPDIVTCRVCGCSDDGACEGGCWWIEEDLCSACGPDSPLNLEAA